jgi:hypothetical protein
MVGRATPYSRANAEMLNRASRGARNVTTLSVFIGR